MRKLPSTFSRQKKNRQTEDFLPHHRQKPSKHKHAEQELKRYQFMVESAHDAIFFKDTKSRYIIANNKTLEAFGLSREQVIGKTDYEIMPNKAEAGENIKDDNLVFKTGKAARITKQMTWADGEQHWLEAVKVPQFDNNNGNIIGLVGIARDITEHKHAERQRERLLRNMQERVKELRCMYGLADSIRRCETLEATFQDVATLIVSCWQYPDITRARICFDGAEYVSEPFEQTNWKQTSDVVVGDRRRGCIEVYYLEERPILDEGPFLKEERYLLDTIARTLSETAERRQAEQQTKDLAKFPSENFFPVLRIAKDGTVLYANAAAQSLLSTWNCQTGQPAPEYWRQLVADAPISGIKKDIEVEHDERIFSFVFAPVAEAGYVNIYGRDITGRKLAEQRQLLAGRILNCLNQSTQTLDVIRETLRIIQEFTGIEAAGVRLRRDQNFPYFVTVGFSRQFVEAENYLCSRNTAGDLILDAQDRPYLECMCGNVLSGRTNPSLPFFTEGGSFWTNSTSQLLASTSERDRLGRTRNRCNAEGYESVALVPLCSAKEIVGLLQLNDTRPNRFTPQMIHFFEGIATSIGIALAKRHAEEALVQSERKFRTLVDDVPGAVYRRALNPDHTVEFISDMIEQICGYRAADFVNSAVRTYPSIIHPHDRKMADKVIRDAVNRRKPYAIEYRIIHADGTIRWVRDQGRAAFGKDHKVLWLDGTIFDITERKSAEEELENAHHSLEIKVRERTAELAKSNVLLKHEIDERHRLEKEILEISEAEQRRIGRGLHDDLGQQLTGLAFTTKALERKLARSRMPEAVDAANIAKLLNEAINHTRDLARMLHPVELDAHGLMFALQELAAKTERLFGVHCPFRCDEPVPVYDRSVAINLYRIAQEAVTNAVKHGRATQVLIALTTAEQTATLAIYNNGIDFPEVLQHSKGMGLQTMDYRARVINASLNVSRAPSGGTLVTCSFKNHQPEK